MNEISGRCAQRAIVSLNGCGDTMARGPNIERKRLDEEATDATLL